MTRVTGRELNTKWRIGATQALYRETGDWYHRLERFPGAPCDQNGYVLFETREQYKSCPHLQIGAEVHVPGGIAAIAGYVRVGNSS